MALLIFGTFRLPPERRAEAQSAMAAMIAASRGEDGCLAYSYADDAVEPGLVRVVELWRDRASFDRHATSAHIAAWRASWPTLGIGERSLVLNEVGDGEPI